MVSITKNRPVSIQRNQPASGSIGVKDPRGVEPASAWEKYGADVPASIATGLRDIPEGAVGLPGNLANLAGAGWGKLNAAVGASDEDVAARSGAMRTAAEGVISPMAAIARALGEMGVITPEHAETAATVAAPSSADVHGVTDPIVTAISPELQAATSHTPTTGAGQFAHTATGFLPMLFGDPPTSMMSGLAKTGTRVLAPAAAVETAGAGAKAIDPALEEPVRFITSMVAGGAAPTIENALKLKQAAALVESSPAALERIRLRMEQDGMSPADIDAKMADLGIRGKPVDIEGNLQQEGQRIVAKGGPGRKVLTEELHQRAETAPGVVRQKVNEQLGPYEDPIDVNAELKGQKETIGKEYQPAYGQAERPVDTTPISDAIDSELAVVKSPGKRGILERIKKSLMLRDSGEMDPSSAGLHEARKAIDVELFDKNGNIKTDLSPEEAGTLKHYRRLIDDELGAANPAVKDVDTRFAEVGQKENAFQKGHDVLDEGKSATSPYALKKEVAKGPHILDYMRKGTRSRIEQILGQKGFNMAGLKAAIKQDGSWNRDKLATLYGDEAADAIGKLLDQEATFQNTNVRVTGQSPTAERMPEDMGGKAALPPGTAALVTTATAGPKAGAVVLGGEAIRAIVDKVRKGAATARDLEVAKLLARQNPELAHALTLAGQKAGVVAPALLQGLLDRMSEGNRP